MSYYVTLPSNGADLTSEYGMKNNTQSDFEIELKKPLDFSYKNYEVGLSQFSCQLSWFINIGNFQIIHKLKKISNIEFELNFNDGVSISSIIEILDTKFSSIPLLNETNEQMEYITFTYDINFNKLFLFVPTDWDLKIEGYFATLLEFIKPHDNKKNFEHILHFTNIIDNTDIIYIKGSYDGVASCVLSKTQINYINEIFIYTNIIENQHVGSQMVRLLRIINVTGLNGNTVAYI